MSIINDTHAIGRRLAELQGKAQPEQPAPSRISKGDPYPPAPASTPAEIFQQGIEAQNEYQKAAGQGINQAPQHHLKTLGRKGLFG